MTVQLMPKPEAFEAFFFRCSSPDQLAELINALRRLRLDNVLRSAIHIGNDYKVLAGLRQYPWEETGGATPLSPEVMLRFREKLGFGYWSASGGIYGTVSQVAGTKQELRKTLAHVKGKLQFLNERTLSIAERFAKPFFLFTRWDIKRTIELVRPVMGLMQGIPTEQPLASAYWRKRFQVPSDPNPDRDRCGLMWYSPMAPANGAEVSELAAMATEALLEYGFEPLISLTVITPRTVACVISITYDREIEGQDESARKCYDELARRCTGRGYYPYRLGIGAMEAYCAIGGTDLAQKAIKKALDPNGILAPGRYGTS
jgi:4-cresol dehydrogenase (hydroxylating)